MGDSPRIEELKRRVQMDPASIAFAALAEEYRRAGQFDDAIATCTAGLRRHPAYISAHVTLGRALMAVGRPIEAREQFEHVVELAPENLAAIRGLAEIHCAAPADESTPSSFRPAVSAEPAARVGGGPWSAITGSGLVIDPANPQHSVSAAPALGGLEQFLLAIARARTAPAGRMLFR